MELTNNLPKKQRSPMKYCKKRKNFTTSEKIEIKKAVEPYFKRLAKERQKQSRGRGKKGKKGKEQVPDLLREQQEGQVRDVIAAFFGETGRQLEKQEDIVEAAEQNPEQFGDILAKVDSCACVYDFSCWVSDC